MAGYNDKITAGDGMRTMWPPFVPERPEHDVWYVNVDGLTVGRATTAYEARQLKSALPGSVIVEPLEVVNRTALALVRALARWEQEELDK